MRLFSSAVGTARGCNEGRAQAIVDHVKIVLDMKWYADKSIQVAAIFNTLGVSRSTLYRCVQIWLCVILRPLLGRSSSHVFLDLQKRNLSHHETLLLSTCCRLCLGDVRQFESRAMFTTDILIRVFVIKCFSPGIQP